MHKILKFLILFITTFVTFLLTSCKKEPFSEPPYQGYSTAILGYPSRSVDDFAGWVDEELLIKKEYTVSYIMKKGIARWVGWQLHASDLGEIERTENFRQDPVLAANVVRVKPGDYAGSGFERGLLCPSEDRTADAKAHASTYLMTNSIPMAPAVQSGVWRELEAYCRDKVKRGYEAHLYAGTHAEGGNGANGLAQTLVKGKISVPRQCWKVILILPEGDKDLQRMATEAVEVIAVDIPNSQIVAGTNWRRWQVTVRELENLTGLNFFSSLPQAVQDKIEN